MFSTLFNNEILFLDFLYFYHDAFQAASLEQIFCIWKQFKQNRLYHNNTDYFTTIQTISQQNNLFHNKTIYFTTIQTFKRR